MINCILLSFKGNWAVSKEAKPLCTRYAVSLSQFLRFQLICIFPAPSICYWILWFLLSALWPMLCASHSRNLLLSLLLFLTVPFFSQTDPALFPLSPCLWICGRGGLGLTMGSFRYGLQCWHSTPSSWEFMWVQSGSSLLLYPVPAFSSCLSHNLEP